MKYGTLRLFSRVYIHIRGVEIISAACLLAILSSGISSLGGVTPPTTVLASSSCPASVATITSVSSPVLYYDNTITPALAGFYEGYQVTNTSSSNYADLWAQAGSFSSSSITLAPEENGIYHVGSLAAGATTWVWFYLGVTSTTSAETFNVSLFSTRPDLASGALCAQSFTVSSATDIKASANKVTSEVSGPTPPQSGGIVTITYNGQTGTIGGSNIFAFTPASFSNWPADVYRLKDVSMTINGVTFNHVSYTTAETAGSYTVVATFVADGVTTAPTSVSPVSHIASGTQVKHVDTTTSTYTSLPALSATTNDLAISASTSPTSLGASGGVSTVTVKLTNSGSVTCTVDSFTDTLPTSPGAPSYVAGTTQYNAVAQAGPSITGSTLTFVGDWTVAPGATSTLTFEIAYPSTIGTYTSSIYGTLGSYQIGTSTTSSTPATVSVTVGPSPQTITFTSTAPSSATVGGSTYTPTATATSGLAVTISLDASSTGCSLSGGVVSFTSKGTCVIDANQSGDSNWQPAPQVQQSFAVGGESQTITFSSSAPTSAQVDGASYTPTATSTSGLPVTITVDASSSSICSIASGVVTFQASGTCTLDANQSGNSVYAAAPQTQQSFGVGPGNQGITFTSTPPASATVGGTYTPAATATSGLPVTFTISSSTSTTCSISSGVVTFNAGGTCTIDANQAGDSNWNPAPQVQQSFTVAKATQAISFTSTAPSSAAVGGTTYTPTATSTSGLTVVLTIDSASSSVCSINGSGVVSFQEVGTCTVDANQAGNGSYLAASQVQQSFTVSPGSQTITFTSAAPSGAVVGGSYSPTATATSGLSVTITVDSSSNSVCTMASGVVQFIGVGTCTLDANQSGDSNWNAASQVQQSFEVSQSSQTISFTSVAPSNATVGGATYTPTAIATSGLPVTLTIDAASSSVCSISGGVVSFQATGTCIVDANQAGNSNYAAAPQVQQSFLVGKGSQTVSFTSSAPSGTSVGGTGYVPTAIATSGLAVTITVDTSSATVCSIGGGVVTYQAVGTCTLDANQGGNTNWNAAPQAQQSFLVGKGSQTISFTSSVPSGATVGGTTYTPTASATSGLAVTFTVDSSSSSVCSISGGVVSFQSAGTCIVDANQPGNANWNPAPQVQQSFSVANSSQTITFTTTAPNGATVGGATYTPAATSTSGLPVSLTIDSSATSVCSMSGGVVSFQATGTCVIDANQAGNSTYAAASQVQQSFAVAKGSQTVAFTSSAPSAAAVGGSGYTPTATATSGLTTTITVDASSAGVCTMTGGVVTYQAVGTCTLDANQAGDSNYNAAPQVQQSFSVGKGSQTITYTTPAPGNATVGGATYTPAATSTSGLTVNITVDPSTSSVCSMSAGTVSFQASGLCVLDANQGGNANWNAAPQVQQAFSVGKGSQTISFTSTAPSSATVGGPTYTPTATSTSGLTVTFTIDSSSSSVCSISGGVVSFLAPGTCTIDANQAGNANYSAASQVQQSFTITASSLSSQTITFTSTPPVNATVGGASYTVTATASSGLPVTFSSGSTAVCTASGATVTFVGAGTCVVDANQAGNSTYAPAPQATQSFTVTTTLQTQTITFTSTNPSPTTVGGTPYTPTATASSGLAVTITLDSSSTGCTLSGGVVSFVAVGTCVIDANQAGNASYSAAPQVQQTITIGKESQTIAFTSTAPSNATVGGPGYTPTATSTSGLPVTFTIDASAAGICALSGGVVTFQAQGTCIVDANQGGDASWGAAPQVQQSFSVTSPILILQPQSITFTSLPPNPAIANGPSYTVTATASSGLSVTITVDSSSSSICSIASDVVTFQTPGTCALDANQSGDALYLPAPQAQQSFSVVAQTVVQLTPTSGTTTTTATPTFTDQLNATNTTKTGPFTYVQTTGDSWLKVSGSGVVTTTGMLAAGSYTATGSIFDLFGDTAPFTFTLQVNPVTINQTAPTSGSTTTTTIAGFGTQLSTLGGNGLVTYATTSAPNGLVVSSTGAVTTSGNLAAGNYSVSGTTADAYGDTGTFTYTLTISKASQTITITTTPPSSTTVGGPGYTPRATSTSGLPVTFSVTPSSAGVCVLSAGTVEFLGAGTCVIEANQAGNALYDAAPTVEQAIVVDAAPIVVPPPTTPPPSPSPSAPPHTYTPPSKYTPPAGTAPTTTVVTSSSQTVGSGKSVSFTATVKSTSRIPSGTVTFMVGTTVLCSDVPLVNGVATCVTTALPTGVDSITATYNGTSRFSRSQNTTPYQQTVLAVVSLSARWIIRDQADQAGGIFLLPSSLHRAHDIKINWGDDTSSAGTLHGREVYGRHHYLKPGHYQVTITLLNANNRPYRFTHVITVRTPHASFPWWAVGVLTLLTLFWILLALVRKLRLVVYDQAEFNALVQEYLDRGFIAISEDATSIALVPRHLSNPIWKFLSVCLRRLPFLRHGVRRAKSSDRLIEIVLEERQ